MMITVCPARRHLLIAMAIGAMAAVVVPIRAERAAVHPASGLQACPHWWRVEGPNLEFAS